MRIVAQLYNMKQTLPPLLLILVFATAANAQRAIVNLDPEAVFSSLQEAAKSNNPEISLPWFDGTNKSFLVLEEANQFAPAHAAKYPSITSYRVTDAEGKTYGRVNRNGKQVYAILLRKDAAPVTLQHDETSAIETQYVLEAVDIAAELDRFTCDVEDPEGEVDKTNLEQRSNSCFVVGNELRRFRMALTNTGEFAGLNGGTLAGVNVAFNNRLAELNSIYESEIAITFQLIANNDLLVNLNASTDPYTDPSNTVISLPATNSYINSIITDPTDFDIGHGLHAVAGSSGTVRGRAGLGVVCGSSKASGYSTLFNSFSLVIFQHEVGHQFNCNHTNYGCDGVKTRDRYEPGQGVTIMGTGTPDCTGTDVYDNRNNFYFNVGSLQVIEDEVNANSGCATIVTSSNSAPSSDASFGVSNTNIPARTPFVLVGGGSDPDGQTLTYNWEDYNTDGTTEANPDQTATSTTAPLFRSFAPSTDNTRYFPELSSILSGTLPNGTNGETMPQVSRTLNFRLTVRDGLIGNACDQVALNVIDTGSPFQITSQNSATTWTANGSNTETITWDVAGTNANGINATNVDILLSTDGGLTFPFAIASNTPNDGSHIFTVPNFATTQGRVMVRGSGYIFLDINDAPITITSGVTCDAATVSISPTTAVVASAGDASLDLTLSPDFGQQLSSPISIIVDTGDPIGAAAANNGSGTCNVYSSGGYYDAGNLLYAGATANITFGSSGSTMPSAFRTASIFQPSFQNSCANFIGGINNITGAGIFSTSISLTQGTQYNLVAFGVNSGNTGTLQVTFSGGTLFDGPPNPGAGFFYTYGVLNSAGNIVEFTASSDLSNATTYPADTYSVFGLNVENGTNLTPYVGGTYANLQNGIASATICAALSTNFVSVEIQAPLPVDLISFTGVVNEKVNTLSWSTASEVNTDRFVVQRSATGEPNSFIDLTAVGATGSQSNYKADDAKPLSGTAYYRLRIEDYDGFMEYSDLVAIAREVPLNSFVLFPNPSRNNQLTVRGLAPEASAPQSSFEVVNLTGQRLLQQSIDLSGGETTVDLPLPAGTYIVRILSGQTVLHTERIVRLPQ